MYDLADVTANSTAGYTLWTMPEGDNIVNGYGGIALFYSNGSLVEFLSYGGTITAVDGPATGKTSKDIGVTETGTVDSLSLQKCAHFDFKWTGPIASTKGEENMSCIAKPTCTSYRQSCTTSADCCSKSCFKSKCATCKSINSPCRRNGDCCNNRCSLFTRRCRETMFS